MLDNHELVQYGTRSEVSALAKRIKIMCPGGDKLSENEALALAQVSTVTGLNPFIGEVWFIPGKGPFVGIKGSRKVDLENVQKKGGYTNVELIACPPEEAGASEAQVKANDVAAAFRCEITDSASSKDYQHNLMEVIRELRAGGETDPVKMAKDICGNRPVTYGWGFSTLGEQSKMGKTALARKRAEADALKKRVSFPFGMQIAAADTREEDVIEGVARDPEPELIVDMKPETAAAFDTILNKEPVDPVDVMFPPSPTAMTLEFAKGVQNSAGVAYDEIPTDKLSFMANQLMKANDEQSRMKLDAVKIILASRTEGVS